MVGLLVLDGGKQMNDGTILALKQYTITKNPQMKIDILKFVKQIDIISFYHVCTLRVLLG